MCQKFHFVVLLALLAFFATSSFAAENCTAEYGKGTEALKLATGSPGALGLVKALAEKFNAKRNTSVCWQKAGSGASLKLLKNKKVDMVMVHAPAAEEKAVKEGWAIKRTLIGSNEFYIVGPKDDPAKIAAAKSVADAYQRIAKSKSKFFSRGDNSGTHKKELMIWKKAGIAPKGDWYIVTKDFMTPTLKRANRDTGYFMTDSSTWVVNKKKMGNLKVLFRGDPLLVNTYHALSAPSGATPGQKWGSEFVDFVGSKEGQGIVGSYGKKEFGEPLYNDAAYAKKYEH